MEARPNWETLLGDLQKLSSTEREQLIAALLR